MSVYRIKRSFTGLYLFFGGLMLYSLTKLVLSKRPVFLLLTLFSIFLIYLFRRILKVTIITTEKTIKQRMFKGERECAWDKIYKIRTIRATTTGNYSTHISWATESQYKNRIEGDNNLNSGVITVSDHFDNYISLLKEIKERAVNAEMDETTIKIITGMK